MTGARRRGLGRPRPVGLALAVLLVAGCAQVGGGVETGTDVPPEGAAPPAALGRVGATQTVRFQPRRLRLPGGATAAVRPATTVAGELRVPEEVSAVGWWDGGAAAGDPFGTTVLAGHVDSATQGLGFFARLLAVRRGDRVELRGAGHRATYRVVSVRAIDQEALAVSSGAFDQRGPHRLVMITCTGAFDPVRRAYSQNLVVTAVPTGPAG